MERTTYMQKKRKGGFTLAEFLVVIAITTILAGVSFVAAIHYQSRLRRLEMDQTAKEIFLAAQNRLSLEKAGGSLERLLAEYPDPENPDSEDKLGLTLSSGSEEKQGLYYILYQPGDEGNNDTEDIRQRLLPFGSIDETVRTDGSYAIGYNPKEGTVREVWYSDKYVFQVTDLESEELAQAALSADKREKYHGEAIGYYNGESMTDPEVIPDPKLKKPTLKIFNGDVLYAEVDDYMSPTAQYTMRLWVEGMSSGAKGWIDLMDFSQRQRVISIGTSGVSYVILDDITWEGFRFAGLSQDLKRSDGGKEGKLIPGEDLRVYAEVSNSNGSVISEIKECNSIFQDITENKVLVSSIRHLENLDYRISGFKPEDSGEAIGLTPAEDGSNGYVVSQQEDLSWTDFRTNVVNQIHISHGDNRVVREADKLSVCYATGSGTYTSLKYTQPGCYAPVNPQFVMSYEGNTHKINDLLVNVKGDTLAGGCFGNVTKDLYVKDLKLVRPDITSETSAGALVGFGINIPDRYGDPVKPLNISVENVFVQYPKITATGEKDAASDTEVDAGALVGAFPGPYNEALMELGALVCIPGTPHCEECPLADLCRGYAAGRADQLPVKPAPKAKGKVPVTVALIESEQGLLLQRRSARGLLAGLWQPAAWEKALTRDELTAALAGIGVQAALDEPLPPAKHVFTHKIWELGGWRGTAPACALPEGYVWAAPEDLAEVYPVPNAFGAYVKAK